MHRFRRSLVQRCVIALAILPGAVQAQVSASPPTAVDSLVETFLAENQVPGVAVAVLHDGALVMARGYGLADIEHSVPVTTETMFQSASIGKQFTAAAILLLAEDGRLKLDDPVTMHLGAAPVAWGGVTIRHLLTHTGGLPEYESLVEWRKDYTESELISTIADSAFLFDPGTRWAYSNAGYMVLGAVVSALTGAHWGVFVDRRVFSPAGMTTARVISESDIVPHRASGYQLAEGTIRNQDWVSPSLLSTGDGALYFSIMDLVRWDQALRRGDILSEASRALWWTPATLNDGRAVGYGFGWDVTVSPNRERVEHGGSFQGFRAYLVRYKDPAVSVAILLNLAGAPHQALAYAIAAAYRPELADPEPEVALVSPLMLGEYAGTWTLLGDTVSIRVEAGQLVIDGLGGSPAYYAPLGDDRFAVVQADDFYRRRLVFVRSGSGINEAWLGLHAETPSERLDRVR